MKDIDLNKIWESDIAKATDHFNSLEDPEKIAQKKSNNILHRIRRIMLQENLIGFGILIPINIGFYYWDKILFWGYLVFCLIAIPVSTLIYLKYSKKLQLVNEKNIREALLAYIGIIEKFIKKLRTIAIIVTPVGFIIGFSMVVLPDLAGKPVNLYLKVFGILTLLVIPMSALIIWFLNKKYIYWLYEKPLNDLKQILTDLDKN